MITVQVEFLWNQEKKIVDLEEKCNIEALFDKLELVGDVKDFFYVVNGLNKMKDYILEDGDHVKVFPAMSGG